MGRGAFPRPYEQIVIRSLCFLFSKRDILATRDGLDGKPNNKYPAM